MRAALKAAKVGRHLPTANIIVIWGNEVVALPTQAEEQKPVFKAQLKVDPHGHKLLCEMIDSLKKDLSEKPFWLRFHVSDWALRCCSNFA